MYKVKNSISKNEIIEGVIWKQLLFFFFPILLGSFFQQLYNTVDAVVVGRFVGKEALAAVGGSAAIIINLVVSFFMGLTSGASVIVSQFFGCDDKKKVNEGIHTIYAFSIIGSILITIIGFALSPMILKMMRTPDELMADSILYLQIFFAGIIFTFIYNTGSGILRALGDSKRPLYSLMICCLLNVILDIIFIVFMNMGIAGAAIATVLSQAISAWLVTFYLLKSRELCQFSLKEIKIHNPMLRSQLFIGLPGGLQGAMYSISNMIIQSSINQFGTDTTAAWAAYGKMDAIFWMISGAFGIAITTFVGQNYGAGKMDRVKKSVRTCCFMHLSMSIIMTIFLVIFQVPLFKIFVNDTHVIEIGCKMLMMMTPFYVLFIFTEVLSGALRGIGDVMIPTFITIGGICLFRVIWILFIVPLRPTLEFTILNYPISWALTSILFFFYYLHKKHKDF